MKKYLLLLLVLAILSLSGCSLLIFETGKAVGSVAYETGKLAGNTVIGAIKLATYPLRSHGNEQPPPPPVNNTDQTIPAETKQA